MSRVDLKLEVKIERTPRVVQTESLFDITKDSHARVEFHFDVPLQERDWNVGLIVGPSGAGKSSVARSLFGKNVVGEFPWHRSRAVVDSFDESIGIRETTELLSSVGFSSPPAWLKPYHVLSMGERFRANLARALADERPLVCVDEFTSVVDRTVARMGSVAVAKAVRRRKRRFVAVSCHDDIIDWLQPDWILEPHVGHFEWRSVQSRPPIKLEFRPVSRELWRLFAPHHYLSRDLASSAKCIGCFVDGKPVAFNAWMPFVGRLGSLRKGMRVHRTVVLPDYQGVGIGRESLNVAASAWLAMNRRVFIRTSHPAEIASRQRDPKWISGVQKKFSPRNRNERNPSIEASRAHTRLGSSFEYVGPKLDRKLAEQLLGGVPDPLQTSHGDPRRHDGAL